MKNIKIGYEIETGEEVVVRPAHLIVTGVTQLSGKTTTLEALIKRSGFKAIVFKTKIGEKSFTEGTETPPFFRDRSDYEFVRSLIEAYAKEKLFLEKGTLMQLCKGSSSLVDIKQKVDEALASGLKGLKEEIYIRLQHYLENLIPQIQYANLSKTLNVYDGINIMNLERFTEEAQSLIIQSVADEVLKTMKDTIIVIPEAWKFIPQKYNNPCKRVIESFIRQGATNNNFIWVDSQDMAGVDKIPLKQISTWILGYQAERNEVKHTLDQIPLPAKDKPKPDEIMTLKKGHFFVTSYEGLKKVYVQPAWLDDEMAISIAKGKTDVDSIGKPDNLVPYSRPSNQATENSVPSKPDMGWKKEIIELRGDFFDKTQELQNAINNINAEVFGIKSSKVEVDIDEIVSKVLQKMPTNGNGGVVDIEEIVKKVVDRIPKQTGAVTYEVAPLEKIKKDFLEEAKSKILADIENLSSDEKKALKYLESRDADVAPSELVIKCFLLKQGGSSSTKISLILKSLVAVESVEKTPGQRYRARLKAKISNLVSTHGATEQEIEQVYNHILMEIIQ